MAFAKIKKPETLNIKDLELLGERQSCYFHFEEIELLMRQTKAEGITVKKITIDNTPYIVLMAISNKLIPNGSTVLNEEGKLLVLPCPRPAIPYGGVEIEIDQLQSILTTIEKSTDDLEETITNLEKKKVIKKHKTLSRIVVEIADNPPSKK